MKVDDTVTGLVLLACAAAIFAYAQSFPPIHGQPYGAGAFPSVIAVGLGLFSALLLWRGVQARRASGGGRLVAFGDWARNPKTAGNFVIALALVAGYVFVADWIGFIPLSIAILLVLFLRQDVRPVTAAIVAVAMSVVIHIAFADFLRVPLPRGILDGVLW